MGLALILIFLFPHLVFPSTIEKLEEKLKGIRSVKVVFVQKVKYSWYPKPEVSKGVFYATRDGKFRIEYTYPDRVTIVSDGEEIVIYNEEDREAIIDKVENNTSPVVESLFFFSRPIGEIFEQIGELRRDDLKVLILRPKERDENVKEVYLELDEDLHIRRVRVIDREDTETIVEFVDKVENFTPTSNLFKIELPEGVKVRRVEEIE